MKKIIIHIVLILLGFLIYFLQSNFFDWFTIAGIKPNLFIIYILFIGLFGTKSTGIIYGSLTGIFLDLVFGNIIGPNIIGYALVGIIAMFFNKNFSKDSRITLIFMVLVSTIAFEILSYFLKYLVSSTNIEILQFIRILLIELIYNAIITIILYPLMQKAGYYIENEYKGNKVLTKYF